MIYIPKPGTDSVKRDNYRTTALTGSSVKPWNE